MTTCTIAPRSLATTHNTVQWDAGLKPHLAQSLGLSESDIQFSIWWDDVRTAYISNVPADSPLWERFTGDRERGRLSLVAAEIVGAINSIAGQPCD